jgi:hypothetical protein
MPLIPDPGVNAYPIFKPGPTMSAIRLFHRWERQALFVGAMIPLALYERNNSAVLMITVITGLALLAFLFGRPATLLEKDRIEKRRRESVLILNRMRNQSSQGRF